VAGRARHSNSVVIAASLVLVVACAIGTRAVPAQEASRRSIWEGVYSDVQANRGEREYGRTCEHCHGAGLEGDAGREIPPLVSDSFMRGWDGKNLRQLFDIMSRSMPADNRGSLSARTYTDLMAYLLRANEVPAGTSGLPDTPGALEPIVFERSAPSGKP
jgi:S-disulfanyl-L-cysteine oxidoreductase SoxD